MRGCGAALAFAIALVGCAGSDALVARAVDRWAAACGRREVPESVYWQYSRRVECGDVAGAIGCTRGRRITMAALAPEAPEALLHEVGHVYGAGHHHGEGVMVESVSSSRHRSCITQDDLDVTGCPDPRPECP